MSESSAPVTDTTPSDKRARLERILREKALQSRRFPLSFAQQRLWFLDRMEGGNTTVYTIPVVLRLHGPLVAKHLRGSLDEITRRHESLRTTFGVNPSDNMPEQVIHAWRPFELRDLDLSREADPWESAKLEALREARSPFDLSRGPLFRGTLLSVGPVDWVLLLTMHHIISDGWSVNVLINELAALYEAYSRGAESPLEDLPVQYTDYAHWHRERLTSELVERQMEYWRQQLKNPPVLELPVKGPRPNAHTFDGTVRVWEIGQDACDAAITLSKAEGITLFMTLLTAFAVLLQRCSGQEDLLIGTPIGNRNRREIEGLIGLFINTLLLRMDLSADPTVRELFARVKETALAAYAHQDVPFEKLVDELAPDRDISRTPLFQVMFVLQPPMPEWKMTDVSVAPWVLEGATSKFEITLSIIEQPGSRLQGWLEYNTNLFDAAMMERFIGHYETLLKAMAAAPSERVSRIPLLPAAERKKLLSDWNNPEADYDLNECMDELVANQTARTPDSTAVVFEGQHLTYTGLDSCAFELAARLVSFGLEPEELVGIAMERSLEMVVALVAVLKTDAAYVPLDPTYPRDRLSFMLEDSGVRLLLTQRRLLDAVPTNGLHVLCLDPDWRKSISSDDGQLPGTRSLKSVDRLAYAIYTSGSTGRPKGVMTSHRGLCNLVLWMQMAFPLSSRDRMLQRTAFSFDASIWEFFWPLVSGAAIVVASPDASADPELLVSTMVEEQVTILQSVQSLFQILLEAPQMRQCLGLRHVFCGGEALSPAVVERLYGSSLTAELHNVYGPTEASMHVTHFPCARGQKERVIPIGRPIGNTRMYVLDPNLELTPIGIPGALYIGGVCLARGYRGRPDLTAERFVPCMYARSSSSSDRIYQTGDLARFREDGNIEFLGRADHQVKIRGYRIELGEIEAHLRDHPAVFQAIALVREDTPGNRRLAAYVVLKEQDQCSGGDLRNFLLTRLPEYMVPQIVVLLDQMPVMGSGKVDRNALPVPEPTDDEREQPYVAPRNKLEEDLVNIFREVLKAETVGIDDNFFRLGGHSLSATQVMIRIRNVLHVEVPLRRLFETPTVAGLAIAVSESQPSEDDEPIEIISKQNSEAEKPLASMLDDLSKEDLEVLLAEIAARKKK